MKSFCGGTKMDDLQGPEVETIRLHVPFQPHILYECAEEESVGADQTIAGFYHIVFTLDKKLFSLNIKVKYH
jgi:hypothetical protein